MIANIVVVPCPTVPITATDACGFHLHQNAIRWTHWYGHGAHSDRPAKTIVDGCIHHVVDVVNLGLPRKVGMFMVAVNLCLKYFSALRTFLWLANFKIQDLKSLFYDS